MNNMSVRNTKKLAIKKVAGCSPRLVQDAALPRLKSKEPESLPDAKLLAIMTAVVEASMCNFLSADAWELTFIQARHTCKEVGIPEEEFDNVLMQLGEARKKRFNANPMSSMF